MSWIASDASTKLYLQQYLFTELLRCLCLSRHCCSKGQLSCKEIFCDKEILWQFPGAESSWNLLYCQCCSWKLLDFSKGNNKVEDKCTAFSSVLLSNLNTENPSHIGTLTSATCSAICKKYFRVHELKGKQTSCFSNIVCLWNLKLALESILALSISALKMERVASDGHLSKLDNNIYLAL